MQAIYSRSARSDWTDSCSCHDTCHKLSDSLISIAIHKYSLNKKKMIYGLPHAGRVVNRAYLASGIANE